MVGSSRPMPGSSRSATVRPPGPACGWACAHRRSSSSAPSSYTVCFQTGTRALSSSIARRHAANAAGRWPAEAATITLGSPTSTRPTRSAARRSRRTPRASRRRWPASRRLRAPRRPRSGRAATARSPPSRRVVPMNVAVPPCSGSATAASSGARSSGSSVSEIIRPTRVARAPPCRHRGGASRGWTTRGSRHTATIRRRRLGDPLRQQLPHRADRRRRGHRQVHAVAPGRLAQGGEEGRTVTRMSTGIGEVYRRGGGAPRKPPDSPVAPDREAVVGSGDASPNARPRPHRAAALAAVKQYEN